MIIFFNEVSRFNVKISLHCDCFFLTISQEKIVTFKFQFEDVAQCSFMSADLHYLRQKVVFIHYDWHLLQCFLIVSVPLTQCFTTCGFAVSSDRWWICSKYFFVLYKICLCVKLWLMFVCECVHTCPRTEPAAWPGQSGRPWGIARF